jgi:hypothetical protein
MATFTTNIPNFALSEEAAKQVLNDKLPKCFKITPTFDAREPSMLTKYLDQLEEIFTHTNVTDDDAKIYIALNYMEYETKKLHQGLAKECGKSWMKFKEEMKKAYPESVDSGKGSVAKLKEIVSRHMIIPLSQHERLLKYIRDFTVEYAKLSKPPAAILNAEAVKYFLKGLDKGFMPAMTLLLPPHDES